MRGLPPGLPGALTMRGRSRIAGQRQVVVTGRTPLALLLPAGLLCLLLALPAIPAADTAVDGRQSLGMTAGERAGFLAEMRQMLASVEGVVTAIAAGDRAAIAAAARRSGNRMARATPESIRQRLPEAFRELGGPTHLMFEELAIRAETDDMQGLTALTGELLQQCLACHAMFRAD